MFGSDPNKRFSRENRKWDLRTESNVFLVLFSLPLFGVCELLLFDMQLFFKVLRHCLFGLLEVSIFHCFEALKFF